MNADQKIQTLFASLTQRYGTPEMKDGQSMAAVFDSWCVSVGSYAADDIMAGLRSWTQQSKHDRWPTEAQFLEILRVNVMARPERQTGQAPAGWKDAEQEVSFWYRREVTGLPPEGWFPFTVEEAVIAFVASKRPSGSRETFAQSLTRLWLAGVIQSEWEAYKGRWIAKANANKVSYGSAALSRGVRFANTHKSRQWTETMNA